MKGAREKKGWFGVGESGGAKNNGKSNKSLRGEIKRRCMN